ncbi:MAG: membrane-bound O-acyltransferase family protein [Flavobacteriaceae bacterium]|nr:membrane-bound O-acyltransferase family protein [Flavobacteriaceae bacterium]
MLFNSFDFAVFFPIFFVLYWVVHKHLTIRNVFLLLSSYVFYAWWDWRFLFLIIFSSIVDFVVGGQIVKAKTKSAKRTLLIISLLTNLGLLAYFKYANFFIDSFINSFNFLGGNLDSFALQIILPVGISFYTFQTLSYTIDIYRGRLQPVKEWLPFFTFVAFFPQLVAGPIERASHLLPQFYKKYNFDYDRVKSGLLLALFGLFKKMVIADRLAVLVNQVYNNPTDYSGFELIIATVFFAFQIYCDFSGYSDIAIGISRTLGFDLMKNFKSPYFSRSITEFWRRWHISLSTWFRDYVYIPLGGSRKGNYRTYANLFIVFLVSGLWHGAAITFIIWGAVHGIFIVFEKILKEQSWTQEDAVAKFNSSYFGQAWWMLFTFVVVTFAWIFFRANSFSDALTVISGSLEMKAITKERLFGLGLVEAELKVALVAILLLLLFEAFHNKFGALKVFNRQFILVRWVFYFIAIFVIIIFGMYGENAPKEFIYFQF